MSANTTCCLKPLCKTRKSTIKGKKKWNLNKIKQKKTEFRGRNETDNTEQHEALNNFPEY